MTDDSAPASEAPRRRNVQREWRGQEIDWVFLMKALPHGACAYGIDQAAKRSREANRRRRARGCKPGVGDTYILWNGITLWLERKAGSVFGEDQETFRDAVLANKGHYAVVESTDEVEAACLAAGIPLRATLGGIRARIAEQNERLPAKKRKTTPGKSSPRFSAGKRMARKMNLTRMG